MAIPTLAEAEQLLASYNLPDGIVTHSRGVSAIAAEAARLLEAAGIEIDPQLVAVAALLHDVDKPQTRGDGQHGLLAARWMTERGYVELAAPIASHPIGCLRDPARTPSGWSSVAVAVADRRVAQAFVTIDERIDDQGRRYPAFHAELEAAREPARAMQASLVAAAGISVEDFETALHRAWEAAMQAQA